MSLLSVVWEGSSWVIVIQRKSFKAAEFVLSSELDPNTDTDDVDMNEAGVMGRKVEN